MHLLQKTSFLILIIFATSFLHSPKHEIFIGFQILVLALFVTSYFFWADPIKNGFWHIWDSRIVRATLAVSILYTIFYNTPKSMEMYGVVLLLFITAFIGSTHYSAIEWSSQNHLHMHAMLHYYGFLIALYTVQ